MHSQRLSLTYWKSPKSDFVALDIQGLSLPPGSSVHLRQSNHAPYKVVFSGNPGGVTEEDVHQALRQISPHGQDWELLCSLAQQTTAPARTRHAGRGAFYLGDRGRRQVRERFAPIPTELEFEQMDPDIKSNPIPSLTSLVVDHREPPQMVGLLRKVGNLDVQVAQLPIGDYCVDGCLVIERKVPIDFANSVIEDDRRLFHQAAAMKMSGLKPIVLIEGDIYSQGRMNVKAVDGMLSYLIMKGMHLFYTRTMAHSASVIAKLVRHHVHGLGYPDPAGSVSATREKKESPDFLLSHIPGVSGMLALRLIERFGSIRGVCLASYDQLLEVRGVGAGTAERIMTALGMVDEARAVRRE